MLMRTENSSLKRFGEGDLDPDETKELSLAVRDALPEKKLLLCVEREDERGELGGETPAS